MTRPMTMRLAYKYFVTGSDWEFEVTPTLQQYVPDDRGKCAWIDVPNEFLGLHTCYEKSDNNIPPQILDRNGDIVLDMCKICGAVESEIRRRPCTGGDE